MARLTTGGILNDDQIVTAIQNGRLRLEDVSQWDNPANAAKASAMMTIGGSDQPIRPKFQSLINQGTGLLESPYLLSGGMDLTGAPDTAKELEDKLSGITVDKRAIEALRERGLSQGPSEWAKLMTGRQGLEEQGLREGAQRRGATQASDAWSQMAMRGGVSGGERERVALEGAKGLNDQLATIGLEGAKARADIGVKDEDTRLGILRDLPGMEVSILQPELQKGQMWGAARQADVGREQDTKKFNIEKNLNTQKYNIDQALMDKRLNSAYDMEGYREAMKAWAAGKQADAEENAGKK